MKRSADCAGIKKRLWTEIAPSVMHLFNHIQARVMDALTIRKLHEMVHARVTFEEILEPFSAMEILFA